MSKEVVLVKSSYGKVCTDMESILDMLNYVPQKKGFFIKPNLAHNSSPSSAVISHPKVVEGLVKYLRKKYPDSEIIIGEGLVLKGVTLEALLKKTGYLYLREKYNVKFVDLEKEERFEVDFFNRKIGIPKIIQTHEYINVAKVKTHTQTVVSLCMKNQKGLLRVKDKSSFHSSGKLFESIKKLNEIVKPDLNILDGIISLEGDGPSNYGKPKKTNFIIASKDLYSADNLATRLMGIDIKSVPYIPEVSDYKVLGISENEASCSFKKAAVGCMKQGNVSIHYDSTLCTFCTLNSVEAFTPSISNIPFLFKLVAAGFTSKKVDIIMGQYNKMPEGASNIICFGNCTKAFAKEHNLDFVKGCPPAVEDIKSTWLEFAKKLSKKN